TTAKLDTTGQRWVSQLALFDFDIKYRPGKNNANADGLSQMPQSEVADTFRGVCGMHKHIELPTKSAEYDITSNDGTNTLPVMTLVELELNQLEDVEVAPALSYRKLQRKPNRKQIDSLNSKTKMIVRQWDKLCVREGVLYRVVNSSNLDPVHQLVLPVKLRRSIFEALHDHMGHLGFERTLDLIRGRFY
ncbi:uncharacterized protein LOC144363180, partial [Saccoglossus kowalevskii]